jgi:hypothetical protein
MPGPTCILWANLPPFSLQLCATHARAAGTFRVLFPCRDCPQDREAHYPDEGGRPRRLCAEHARAAGLAIGRRVIETRPNIYIFYG